MTARRDVPGIKAYDSPAGGWGALRATARAIREQMDLTDASLLLSTNQPQGFDCPGCAWPDKDERSTFQFCENGAKAVSWEATRKRAPPEFSLIRILLSSMTPAKKAAFFTSPWNWSKAAACNRCSTNIKRFRFRAQ